MEEVYGVDKITEIGACKIQEWRMKYKEIQSFKNKRVRGVIINKD